jgi:hypothetical protein
VTDLLTAIYGFGWVPTALWVLLAWVVSSVLVGLVVGRIVRLRDMQVPDLSPSPGRVDDVDEVHGSVP